MLKLKCRVFRIAVCLTVLMACAVFFTATAKPALAKAEQESKLKCPEEKEKKEHRDAMFRKIVMLKMTWLADELSLTDSQFQKFLAIFKKNELAKKEGFEKMMELAKEIEGTLKEEPKNEAKLKSLIKEILGQREANDKLENKFISELMGLLSVNQQAKLVVVLPRMEREIRSAIRARMQEKMREHHPGNPGFPSPKDKEEPEEPEEE